MQSDQEGNDQRINESLYEFEKQLKGYLQYQQQLLFSSQIDTYQYIPLAEVIQGSLELNDQTLMSCFIEAAYCYTSCESYFKNKLRPVLKLAISSKQIHQGSGAIPVYIICQLKKEQYNGLKNDLCETFNLLKFCKNPAFSGLLQFCNKGSTCLQIINQLQKQEPFSERSILAQILQYTILGHMCRQDLHTINQYAKGDIEPTEVISIQIKLSKNFAKDYLNKKVTSCTKSENNQQRYFVNIRVGFLLQPTILTKDFLTLMGQSLSQSSNQMDYSFEIKTQQNNSIQYFHASILSRRPSVRIEVCMIIDQAIVANLVVKKYLKSCSESKEIDFTFEELVRQLQHYNKWIVSNYDALMGL